MMRKLIIILFIAISFIAKSQGIEQEFGANAPTLDSLFTHVGRQMQYVLVYGINTPNDGFGAMYYYDSNSVAAINIPFVFKVAGKDTGRWIQLQFRTTGDTAALIPKWIVLN